MKAKVKRQKSKMYTRKSITGYLFLAPFLILFITFTMIPIAVAMGLSLTNYNLVQTPEFVGLTNYRNLILEDDVFLKSLSNTILFAILTGPTGYLASFMMAWLITLMNKGRGAFALAFYAPSLTSGIAMSTIWLIIFSGDRNGYLNNFLMNLGVIVEPILWTKDADFLKWVIVIISVWMSMGTGFLVFLAGLQNIDPMYYTAAKVDGAGPIKIFFRITIPLLMPTIFLVVIINTISTFKVFNELFPLFNGPGIANNLFTVVYYIYYQFRVKMPSRYGYAAAAAVVLFGVIFVFTMIQKWVEKKTNE